jgi:putative membrane protein
MKRPLLATAICALPLAAAAQTPSLSAQDKTFITGAADAGLAEVTDGQLAESKGNATVKQIGTRMVADHGQANAKLAALSQQLGDPAPTTTSPMYRLKTGELQVLSGTTFDTQYLSGQRTAHINAIALFKKEIANGGNADLKSFASTTLPTLQMHLTMIEAAMKSTNS